MKKNKVIGILSADWHLSHKPPVWRSNEPDWYAAMERPLDEISALAEKHCCPVLCAGDIFDKWNSPPELINWAIQHIPVDVYSIPGQHDIPNHNIEEMEKSAYRVLDKTQTIKNISWREPECEDEYEFVHNDLCVSSFPYGFKILKAPYDKMPIQLALVHDYVWIKGHSYPNAPKEKNFIHCSKHMIKNKYCGYDVICYGDNHSGFLTKVGDTTIFNCGTLMRRKSDEENYKPMVGLLYSDGNVEPYYLDTSKDIHLTAEEAKQKEEIEDFDMTLFANELKKLGASALDFAEAIKQYNRSQKVEQPVQNIIRKAMGK